MTNSRETFVRLPEGRALKQCCATLYESEIARWLLGGTFHPGALALTGRLGARLALGAGDRVLDVASGRGTSALHLAELFGCEVVGIDYGQQNVESAGAEAAARGLSGRVAFRHADAESLPFPDGAFDALVCECAFCTFPDKARAAREFARVLKADGRIGLADVTRAAALPRQLENMLAWIACIADAQPVERYSNLLEAAGFTITTVESHREALRDLVREVRGRLLAAEAVQGLGKIEVPGFDLTGAREMAKAAAEAVERGELGYVLMIGVKA
jgi:ubiquinone/menaquinone biosynthesis C-methylase UbiE